MSNIRTWDRVIRYFLGIILLTWAIGGGPGWTYVGIFFIVTASFGNCPVYWVLRINSRA